jgi:hypothetical protein
MKKYILLLFFGLTGTLNAQNHLLNVPFVGVYPNRSEWCAVAASECVLRYRGINKDQCKIMEEYVKKNSPSHGGPNGFNCCQEIPNFSQHPCNKGVPLGYFDEKVSVKAILKYFGNLHSYRLKLFLRCYYFCLPLDKCYFRLYISSINF